MLVLNRRLGEIIRIGNQGEITIKILAQENGVTRIGITAPTHIRVDREEIHQIRKIRKRNSANKYYEVQKYFAYPGSQPGYNDEWE